MILAFVEPNFFNLSRTPSYTENRKKRRLGLDILNFSGHFIIVNAEFLKRVILRCKRQSYPFFNILT